MSKITIATRGSMLALWQANHIKDLLAARYEDLETELLTIRTKGDKVLDVPLASIGGKGLFVKEIEEALLDGRADLAVHSMKDVPMVLPDGLMLGAVLEREVSNDLFVSEKYPTLDSLPPGAVVGTSSLRRQAQLLSYRPDLMVSMLRGNVETRVRKVREGQFDAVILAEAGMKRLGIHAAHTQALTPPAFLPAVGQGALGIEIRADRQDVKDIISFLNHAETMLCLTAERAFLRRLDGGCQVPIAAHAIIDRATLELTGLVADVAGKTVLRDTLSCPASSTQAAALGTALAEQLLSQGADAILSELYGKESSL